MKIAIVIASNGLIAKEILNVAEYTTGRVSNVSSIAFLPGENLEGLFERYRATLLKLDIQHGILFLIDSRSSCHQFVAGCFAHEHRGSQVVTGVNLPMLQSLFVSESNETNPLRLASKACEYGQEAICAVANRVEIDSTEADITAYELND